MTMETTLLEFSGFLKRPLTSVCMAPTARQGPPVLPILRDAFGEVDRAGSKPNEAAEDGGNPVKRWWMANTPHESIWQCLGMFRNSLKKRQFKDLHRIQNIRLNWFDWKQDHFF